MMPDVTLFLYGMITVWKLDHVPKNGDRFELPDSWSKIDEMFVRGDRNIVILMHGGAWTLSGPHTFKSANSGKEVVGFELVEPID